MRNGEHNAPERLFRRGRHARGFARIESEEGKSDRPAAGVCGARKGAAYAGCALSALNAALAIVPYLCVWFAVRDLVSAYPHWEQADSAFTWAALAAASSVLGIAVYFSPHGHALGRVSHSFLHAQGDDAPYRAHPDGAIQHALFGGVATRDRCLRRPDRRRHRPQAPRFRRVVCHAFHVSGLRIRVRCDDGGALPDFHRRFFRRDVVDDGTRRRWGRPAFHAAISGCVGAHEFNGHRIRPRHSRREGIPADGAFVQGVLRGDRRLPRHGDTLRRVLPQAAGRAAGRGRIRRSRFWRLPALFWRSPRPTSPPFWSTSCSTCSFSAVTTTMMTKVMYSSEAIMSAEDALSRVDSIMGVAPVVEADASRRAIRSMRDRIRRRRLRLSGVEPACAAKHLVARARRHDGRLRRAVGRREIDARLAYSAFLGCDRGRRDGGRRRCARCAHRGTHGRRGVRVPNERLFKRSLADNVRAGRPEATDDEVLEALRAARCDDIVAKLPDGMHTVVGARGVHLSGGECQRFVFRPGRF